MEASDEYPKRDRGRGLCRRHTSTTSATGPGFRKVRKGLGVTAFGVNAIVLPAGYRDRVPLPRRAGGAVLRAPRHDRDGVRRRLRAASCGEGGLARVDAATVRKIRNAGDVDAMYLCAGGKDGYVGRDGRVPEGEEQRVRALHDLGGGRADAEAGRARAGLRLGPAASTPACASRSARSRSATSRSSGPGRPARERHRLARGSRLRRRRLALAQRGAARAPARTRRPARRGRRPGRPLAGAQPRARARAAAPSGSPGLCTRPARAGRRARPPPRASAGCRPSAGPRSASASGAAPAPRATARRRRRRGPFGRAGWPYGWAPAEAGAEPGMPRAVRSTRSRLPD